MRTRFVNHLMQFLSKTTTLLRNRSERNYIRKCTYTMYNKFEILQNCNIHFGFDFDVRVNNKIIFVFILHLVASFNF